MTDLAAVLGALDGADVLVVGGVAGNVHGAARTTTDLDLLYGRSPGNLDRLSVGLAPFLPYLRGAPPGLPFTLDAETLRRGLNFTLTTTAGDVDLLGELLGVGSFEVAAGRALYTDLFGHRVGILGLDDLIASKRAAGRVKDLLALAELEALRDR